MKARLTICFLCIYCFNYCLAQDPTFSQYNSTPLYINPALTGIDEGLRINTDYRTLWSTIPSSFPSYTISADLQSLCISSGQGIIAMNDMEGEGKLRTSKIGGLYSYRIILKPRIAFLQAGVEVDYVQKKIDWSRLVFSDQIDSLQGVYQPTGNVSPNQESTSYPDFHFGVAGRFNVMHHQKHTSTVLVGFAVHHLTKPNESILGLTSTLPPKYTIHGEWVFNLNHRYRNKKNLFLLGPTFLWEIQDVMNSYLTNFDRPFQTFNFGLAIQNLPFYSSIAIRTKTPVIADVAHSDALILNLALDGKFSEDFRYRIGYSYDLTISRLGGTSSGGSHEITLRFTFPNASPLCAAINADPAGMRKKKMDCFHF